LIVANRRSRARTSSPDASVGGGNPECSTKSWIPAFHETFYWAMMASGVENWRAKSMYAAVYHFGPRWARKVTVERLPVDQTPVARQRALEQAAPGSSARILNVRPYAAFPGTVQSADFEVEVLPPPRTLTEEDYEKLRATIDEREPTGSPMRLDEIRRYRR
jgi:hypothetical protein